MAQTAALRRLLRQCRKVDRHPEWLVSLVGRPPRQFNREVGRNTRAYEATWVFVDDALAKAGGGCTEFLQPLLGARSTTRAARGHYPLAQALGLDYEAEAAEFERRLEIARSIFEELAGHPSAAAHAKEPRLERFPLQRVPPNTDAVRNGDVLICHPLSCILQPIFDQAVMLVDDVGNGLESEGVRGVVLNRPAGATLQELMVKWPGDHAGLEDLGPLTDMQLFLGGPVLAGSLRESLTLVHSFDVAGSVELAGLRVGGEVQELAALAAHKPHELRICIGYAGWATEQLATELERGVWVHARPQSRLGVCQNPEAFWRDSLRAAGMPLLASFPRGPGVDRHLERLLLKHYQESRS